MIPGLSLSLPVPLFMPKTHTHTHTHYLSEKRPDGKITFWPGLSACRSTSGLRYVTSFSVISLFLMISSMVSPARTGYVRVPPFPTPAHAGPAHPTHLAKHRARDKERKNTKKIHHTISNPAHDCHIALAIRLGRQKKGLALVNVVKVDSWV